MTDYLRWRDALATANDPAFYPVSHQDMILRTGQAQFWACDSAAIITWLKPYPGGALVCETYAAAGQPEAMVQVLKSQIEAWATAVGCSDCFITAKRRGMARLHPDYEHVQSVLRKALA